MATIRPADVSEWVQVRDRIRQLESLNIPSVKATQESKRAQAEREVEALRVSVAQKQKRKAKEEKDLAKIEKKGMTRFAARIGGNLEGKVEKERQEAVEAAADLQKTEASLAARRAELSRIVAGLAPVYADEATLASLYQQQKAILERVFWGPSGAGDQAEKSLQGEVAAIQPDLEALQRQARDQTEAHKHMLKAVQLCGNSLQFLRQAVQLGQTDMMMDIGPRNGGMAGHMVNFRKQQAINQAGAQLQLAAREVDAARAFMPQIQPMDPRLVKTMGAMVDVVFDNMMTDMIIMKQVRESMARVEPLYMYLQQGQDWVGGVKRQTDERFYAVRAQHEAKLNALKQHRWMLIESAASGVPPADYGTAPSAPPPSMATPAPGGPPVPFPAGYPQEPTNYKPPDTAPPAPFAPPVPVPSGYPQEPANYKPPGTAAPAPVGPPIPVPEYPQEPTDYKPPVFPGPPETTRSPSLHRESPF